MRVLVTGANGQLGSELVQLYAARSGDEVLGIDLPELDITSTESVAHTVSEFKPDVVINCAAWTAVDAAEENEPAAMAVNGEGPEKLAAACRVTGAWLVQLSTDYVFSGEATTPYAEDAAPDPRSAYGRTKLAGEIAVQSMLPDAHYIVRTAWLYGHQGSNFVKTMLRLEKERETIDVVDDQIGQPTYAADLAAQIVALVDARPAAGIFHGTNSGEVSWHGFTQEIFRQIGADPARVIAVTSEQFVRPAPRPAYSVLGHRRWAEVGLTEMRDWREAITEAMQRGFD
ncbi:MAG TPA: dTDP-4-dehydrorhamnose reductase [Candidatus Nanopelagicales bacterium]|nr:dTDP-4-dehydrorhamnose reductase [Candidatus Nanopelagicales bacterium]